MFIRRRRERLSHDEMVAKLKCGPMSTSICEKVALIARNRQYALVLADSEFDSCFDKLESLAAEGDAALNVKILQNNSPPPLTSEVAPAHFFWAEILYILLDLNASFDLTSGAALCRQCLVQTTNVGFALGHSTVLRLLAESHILSVEPSLVELLISSTTDSRAIYALKFAGVVEDWDSVKRAVFRAMLWGATPKKVEAMWLFVSRGNVEDAIKFAFEFQVELPKSVRRSGDIKAISRTVFETNHKPDRPGIDYAVRVGGPKFSPKDLDELQRLIRDHTPLQQERGQTHTFPTDCEE